MAYIKGNEILFSPQIIKGNIKLQSKNATPRATAQTIRPDDGCDGLLYVVVEGDTNLVSENIAEGVTIFGVTGTHSGGGSTGDTNKMSQIIDRTVMAITAEDLQGVTSIGSYAFAGCYNLMEVEIPESVVSIEDHAFEGCHQDLRLIMKSTTPPYLGYSALPDGFLDYGTIELPDGAKNAYKNATNWSYYASTMVGGENTGGEDLEGNWLFKDEYVGSNGREDLPVPVEGMSYTLFVDGEEIATSTAEGYVGYGGDEIYLDFHTEDYLIWFRYQGWWHFHPIDSQVQSGRVSIRIND